MSPESIGLQNRPTVETPQVRRTRRWVRATMIVLPVVAAVVEVDQRLVSSRGPL